MLSLVHHFISQLTLCNLQWKIAIRLHIILIIIISIIRWWPVLTDEVHNHLHPSPTTSTSTTLQDGRGAWSSWVLWVMKWSNNDCWRSTIHIIMMQSLKGWNRLSRKKDIFINTKCISKVHNTILLVCSCNVSKFVCNINANNVFWLFWPDKRKKMLLVS